MASREDDTALASAGSPSCSRVTTFMSNSSYFWRSCPTVTPDEPVVKRFELCEQIIHLVLERQLRKQAYCSSVAQALFEPLEIERLWSRGLG